jgi:hypothetical protein
MLYAIYDLHNVKYIGKRVRPTLLWRIPRHGTVDVRLLREPARPMRPSWGST